MYIVLLKHTCFFQVIYTCTTLVYSVAIAVVLYIGFELPWLNTEKIVVSWIFKGGNQRQKRHKVEHVNY